MNLSALNIMLRNEIVNVSYGTRVKITLRVSPVNTEANEGGTARVDLPEPRTKRDYLYCTTP